MKICRKILIVTSEFPPQPGGIGNHAFNLAHHLQLNGFFVHVQTDYRSYNKQLEQAFDKKQSFQISRIPRYKLLVFTYLYRIFKYLRLSYSFKPDVIISSGRFPMYMVSRLTRSNSRKLAVVHGSEMLKRKLELLPEVRRALRKMDQVIAVSEFTKSLVEKEDIKNLMVITNGFDPTSFDLKKNDIHLKGNPKLITVGSVSQRKGQQNVVKLLPALLNKYPEVHYHIVGIDDAKEGITALMQGLKVADFVTFHGAVNQQQLNDLLNDCDIFVMLSESTDDGDVEGFGIAIIEANYLGLPAIGTLNTGITDAIADGKSGRLVELNDKESFVGAVDDVLTNIEKYAKASKEWANSHKWEQRIKAYINLICKE